MPFSSNEEAQKWRNKNRPRFREILRTTSKIRRDKLKIEIFALLGNKCSNSNCAVPNGMTDPRALQIDHVHGGGSGKRTREHRGPNETYYNHILKEIKAGSRDYQLLCANCNWIKRYENKEIGGRPRLKPATFK